MEVWQWTEFNNQRSWFTGWFWWTKECILGFHRRLETAWLAEKLSASQEGLCCIVSVLNYRSSSGAVWACLLITPVLHVLVLVCQWVPVFQAGGLCCSASKMMASKDMCSVCKEAFYGKHALRCSGPCASWFHPICLRLSDDTTCHSTPKADYDSDIVACSNLDMNLCAQLESIHANGVCTDILIEKLVNIVLKLSDEIRIL
jgi:hypothetical protein